MKANERSASIKPIDAWLENDISVLETKKNVKMRLGSAEVRMIDRPFFNVVFLSPPYSLFGK